MKYRRYDAELVGVQDTIRRLLISQLFEFDSANLESILLQEAQIKDLLSQLERATKSTSDALFFTNYRLIIHSLYHLLHWSHDELHAEITADGHLNAARANARRIKLDKVAYPEPFKIKLLELRTLIKNPIEPPDIDVVVGNFLQLAFPTIYSFEKMPSKQSHTPLTENSETGISQQPLLLSVEFTVDNEAWANPQVLAPAVTYTIRGQLTPNYWPIGFERLVLTSLSTTSPGFYDLQIPNVSPTQSEIPYYTTGHVAFKYPQSRFDHAIAIRLLAYYENNFGEKLFPTLIGYDQLIAKVLDRDVAYFPTGFKRMNQVVLNIIEDIQKQLPKIDQSELQDFAKLLSGIVNYQGFCLQHGVFKGQTTISEDIFRDKLIQHLVAIPDLGEHIIKEAHLAGGRVEISYKGIVAELKVEKSISDRDKLLEKYGKQAVAYASGNIKQLSIVSVLDLTTKNRPPAPPQNNVKIFKPAVHGFESSFLEYPSMQVLVVIDGNTKKPSDYSK